MKATPTTNKSAIMKVAKAIGLQTVHQRYSDIKNGIKEFFKVRSSEPDKKWERNLEAQSDMSQFMARIIAAKQAGLPEPPPPTALPQGAAATQPAPRANGDGGGGKGGNKGGEEHTLDVCNNGVPAQRIFKCSGAF